MTYTTLPADRTSGVNKHLTPKRRYRAVENDEYAAFVRRVIRAYSRRIAEGDIEAIGTMVNLADHLDTAIRQLRAHGLRPGGQPVTAQILWNHHGKRRVAYLYNAELAKPKRQATPAQLAAIGKALAARRTCATCGIEKAYCISRSTGQCNDCNER